MFSNFFRRFTREARPNYDEVVAHPEYVLYTDRRAQAAAQAGRPIADYRDYDPEENPDPNRRKMEGERNVLQEAYKMNPPTDPDAPLPPAQGEQGYSAQHPSERDIPRGARNLPIPFGEKEGLPLFGPASWEWYFVGWTSFPNLPPIVTPGQGGNLVLSQDDIDLFNKYGFTFINQLGRGGFGWVWRVHRRQHDVRTGVTTDVEMACKVLDFRVVHRNYHASPLETMSEMMKEIDICRKLNHPNLVTIDYLFHQHDPETGFPYVRILVFMQLCEGDLARYLHHLPGVHKKLPEDEARLIMRDLCNGLKYMHDQQIIHFDIKPQNILYVTDQTTGNRVYKLTDFGLSLVYKKKLGTGPRVTEWGGTITYMAPELNDPDTETSAKKCDIYSMGCTMAEMVYGINWQMEIGHIRSIMRHNPSQLSQELSYLGVTRNAAHLINAMTHPEHEVRPKIKKVLNHPWMRI